MHYATANGTALSGPDYTAVAGSLSFPAGTTTRAVTVSVRGDVTVEPNETGKGFEFENKIVGGSIPREYIPAVEKGIREALDTGVLAGYPMVDIKARLTDGSYHDVDSSAMAFKIAAQMALKAAAKKAHPVLLEPVMEFEVTTPEEFLGDVMGDVTARRGRIGSC